MKSSDILSFTAVVLSFVFVFLLKADESKCEIWKDFKQAPPNPALSQLKKNVDAILNKRNLQAGAIAVSLDSGEILYQYNPDELLIPASVNKVFTSYAALKKLKPSFTFKTTVHALGEVKNDTLYGDLYLKGGGDPSLVSERMWMLVNELVRSGIKKITGNLIADSSYFDEEKTPDSRPKYLKDQAYNAPIGALSFNFNTCTIYVRPAQTPGLPPIVFTDPENSYVEVVNQAKTGKAGSRDTLAVSRTSYVKGDVGDTVLLRGSVPLDEKELRFYKNIVNPALYTAHMFKTFWERRGLKLMGNVKEGILPSGTKQILEFESLPLWQVIYGMNKFSNNFVADQILKKIGAEKWGTPGTREKGVVALQETLEDLGINKRSYTIVDGSGLTRKTRVSPRQILTVLAAAYHDFGIAPEFESSLGVAGEDGTLRRRFPNSIVQDQLRAKTGTLDGVYSLAGFTPDGDGERIAFAIVLNDPKLKYGRMTGWIDQIALALARLSRK